MDQPEYAVIAFLTLVRKATKKVYLHFSVSLDFRTCKVFTTILSCCFYIAVFWFSALSFIYRFKHESSEQVMEQAQWDFLFWPLGPIFAKMQSCILLRSLDRSIYLERCQNTNKEILYVLLYFVWPFGLLDIQLSQKELLYIFL